MLAPQNTPEEFKGFQTPSSPSLSEIELAYSEDQECSEEDNRAKSKQTKKKDFSNNPLQDVIDMRKYYLMRKASQPPKVPPKAK